MDQRNVDVPVIALPLAESLHDGGDLHEVGSRAGNQYEFHAGQTRTGVIQLEPASRIRRDVISGEPWLCRTQSPAIKSRVMLIQPEVLLTGSKILIISYLFPPVGAIGVQRARILDAVTRPMR